jgi:hypothetical protein
MKTLDEQIAIVTPAQEEAARRAEVMLAFSRGEALEVCALNTVVGNTQRWEVHTNPGWDWARWNYRVKSCPVELRVRLALDSTGTLITSHVLGFITPEEVHRRINAGVSELVFTVREVTDGS